MQLPTFGVAVDAEGVLKHEQIEDPDGRLAAERLAAARAALPRDVAALARLRKISLPRLAAALGRQLAAGGKPGDVERHLAGLTRIRYVFLYPESRDIVIAGEAGGWVTDAAGRAISLDGARPVLELADLCVALRAFPPGGRAAPFVGCSIDPSPEALGRLIDFQRTVPRAVSQRERGEVAARIDRGLREALGMSEIRVFGVPAATHFAQVMVEADYRMKLIGIDLEPPPVKMSTYLGALQSAGQGQLERWWFQPDYQCVKVTNDRHGMELVGQGVRLLTENMAIGPGGKLLHPTSRPSAAAALFAKAFTSKYPQIAARSPVFAQLRNNVDLLIVAAFMAREGYYAKAGWDQGCLADERQLPTETVRPAKRAPCAVNVVWKGSRLLAPAGGVSITATDALKPENVSADDGGRLATQRDGIAKRPDGDRWWWD